MDRLPGSILPVNLSVLLQRWDRMVRFISEMKMELFMQSTRMELQNGLMRLTYRDTNKSILSSPALDLSGNIYFGSGNG